jgi:hypothetical protein
MRSTVEKEDQVFSGGGRWESSVFFFAMSTFCIGFLHVLMKGRMERRQKEHFE